MRKTMSRLFMAVLMVALLVSASIMSVSAANEGPTCDGKHEGWTAIGAGDTITAGGKYYLTEDRGGFSVTGTGTEELTVCLHGHQITSSWAMFNQIKTVNLVNCVKGDNANFVGDGNAFYLAGGTTMNIGENVKVSSTGQAIFLQGGSTVNIYGGTIEGTASEANGAGIYLSSGTINMYDGTITGKTTESGGGVYVNSGTFNMYGGTISGCTARIGGGVRNHGTFNMYGGTISGNTATEHGSAIYFEGTTNVVDGTIAGTGLGISSNNTSTFIVSGGEFATEIWLGGNAEITGGKFSNKPDDAWLADGYVTADVEDGDYLYKVCADGFYTTGEHMDFDSSLALGLYLNKSTEGYDVAVSGGYTCSVSDDPTFDTHAIFAEGIAAKAMDEKITYTITNTAGEVLFRKTVSIYDAAEKWLADGNPNDNDLVVDMINYGREAQKAFLGGYKMDSLGDTDTVADWNVVDGHGVNAGYENDVAVTLSLKDQIELNVYIKGEVKESDVSASESFVFESGNGITRISFKDIPVVEAHKAVELKVVNGPEVKFSIADYCALAKDGAQKDLINALMKYIKSVCDYVN